MSRRPRVAPLATAAATALLALSGCSTGPSGGQAATSAATEGTHHPTAADGADQAASQVDPEAFPVTIKHALGETTIEAEPQRVVTLGWSEQDVVLSLGVTPVGATRLTWGGNDAGSSEWFDTALNATGADQPTRYADTDGVPIEEIAALAPDLILASNSGITEQDYVKLAKIADVVAYPEAPWVTPWQRQVEIAGQALGRTKQAAEVIAETEAVIEKARAACPDLQGKTAVFAYLSATDLSQIGIYGREDNRVRVLEELGLVSPTWVDEVVPDGEFYANLSAERAADVEADILLTYAEKASDLAMFTKDPLVGRIPALQRGTAYAELDKHVGLAITNPSPLSMTYLIEHYLPEVARAAGVAPGQAG